MLKQLSERCREAGVVALRDDTDSLKWLHKQSLVCCLVDCLDSLRVYCNDPERHVAYISAMAQTTQNFHNDSALNDRSLRILKVLVEEYIRHGQPIGSGTLSRTSGLKLSSATVRNVVADLEAMGFVRSPHTSAGRIPTALGYRLFVDTLLKQCPPVAGDLKRMRVQLDPDRAAGDLVESASDVLSGITHLAGVVTLPRGIQSALRQIEFLPLSGQRVLAILVMNQRDVQNRIIQLDRDYSKSELEQIANYLNTHFAGRDLRAIRGELLRELDEMRADMDRLMRSAIELGGKALADEEPGEGGYILAGQSNLLEYQELADLDRLREENEENQRRAEEEAQRKAEEEEAERVRAAEAEEEAAKAKKPEQAAPKPAPKGAPAAPSRRVGPDSFRSVAPRPPERRPQAAQARGTQADGAPAAREGARSGAQRTAGGAGRPGFGARAGAGAA
ncbi:MAG: heat-inducible transcriptional repressor HrcA, partial [Acidihalobacter sp.]